MAYIIAAEIAQLRTNANTIDTNAAQIRKEVEEIHQLLSTLRTTFIGQRSTGFFQKYDQAYTTMNQWDEVVKSFAEEMLEAAARLQAADSAS